MTVRQTLLWAATLVSTAVWAQSNTLGTKKDIVLPQTPANRPIVEGQGIIQLVVALGIVFVLLKFGLPKLLSAINKKSGKSGTAITVEETTVFGGGMLGVVSVRGRTLLIGSTANSVACLADLGTTEEPASSEPAFFEILDSAAANPIAEVAASQQKTVAQTYGVAAVELDETPAPAASPADELKSRLERLAKLAN